MVRPNCRPCSGAAIARCARPAAPKSSLTRLQTRSFHQTLAAADTHTPRRPLAASTASMASTASAASTLITTTATQSTSMAPTIIYSARSFHTTPANAGITDRIGDMARQALKRTIEPYGIFGATRRMYQKCTTQGAYKISEEARRNEDVPTTDDGEEIGSGTTIWHSEFNMTPSFSTWTQITMLHMYLLVTRLRCFDKETYRMWQSMLVDNFFQEAEDKMDIVHHISSRGLRQRYLQDLFMVWRGVMVAYDEGLMRGDAVLAAAVWRNMFKAQPDVDARHLAAIVSYIRRSISRLDRTPDEVFILHAGGELFSDTKAWPPPTADLGLVDEPATKEMVLLLKEAERLEAEQAKTAPVIETVVEEAEKAADKAASA